MRCLRSVLIRFVVDCVCFADVGRFVRCCALLFLVLMIVFACWLLLFVFVRCIVLFGLCALGSVVGIVCVFAVAVLCLLARVLLIVCCWFLLLFCLSLVWLVLLVVVVCLC